MLEAALVGRGIGEFSAVTHCGGGGGGRGDAIMCKGDVAKSGWWKEMIRWEKDDEAMDVAQGFLPQFLPLRLEYYSLFFSSPVFTQPNFPTLPLIIDSDLCA